jgi:excinuclease ABC subunit A
MSLPHGSRLQILAPIVRDRKGEYRKELQQMRREGFIRARIDSKMMDLTQDIILKKQKRHTIEIVIDRFIIKPGIERQIKESVETALRYSDTVIIHLIDENRDILFSKTMACSKCGISYPEINPMFFSFNSMQGACPRCKGLGFENLEVVTTRFQEESAAPEEHKVCRLCNGLRLKREALNIKIQNINIGEFAKMSAEDALLFIDNLTLSEREQSIASRVLKEVRDRLNFLNKVGLSYLALDRSSLTLAGGESQRIRLATQLGSSLTGVLYVLDEPTIGMHPRDTIKLLESLSFIRDAGNTIIVVEHDEETIKWADHIIDMGPGAGLNGGLIVASGKPEEIVENDKSITGNYLNGTLSIDIPLVRRKPKDFIRILGAQEFNLKGIEVNIPLGTFTCITGVSGSGKSTLVLEILYKALLKEIYGSKVIPGQYREIIGTDKIDRVICVDQSPLGKTPRSNPATYSGVFSFIRELFSQVTDSKIRGYTPSRFSFNLSGGRCESCHGDGLVKVEMHFLPPVYILCDICKGKRYNRETLEIRYKDKNIAEILDMTISEALQFFSSIPHISHKLKILEDVGLGYLQLGQPASTLSGGEAQRVRLAKELGRKLASNTLYILDEPTTGLHYVDINKLLTVIDKLVDLGNSVIIIEHNLDMIKSADYIIDLGPEGGEKGGRIVAEGTPEEICMNHDSYTSQFLRKKLARLTDARVA